MAIPDVNPALAAALSYAARGWRVVPIRPGEKHPAVQAWQDAATVDFGIITDWWTRWPHHGVGIVTGILSAIFVLDIDMGDGKFGDETLIDLERTYGRLPDTVEVVTGSGGRHLYFRWPVGRLITNDAGLRLGLHIDVRGEGGQVLAPPTVHPNGTAYEWEASAHPDDVDVAEAPEWLVDLLTSSSTAEPRAERGPADPSTPGSQWAATTTWPELLVADGAVFLDTRQDREGGDYELWARPGIGGDHTSATLYYGGTDLLKVHTPNWPGLVQGEVYTKFGYLTATRYAGNFHDAAGALRAQGFGGIMDPNDLIGNPQPAVEGETWIGPRPIDWPEFWAADRSEIEWCCYPILPRGRQAAMWAVHKTGKSLLTLDIAAAAATGRPMLGGPPIEPIDVVYMDMEMTEDDLEERLADMGYGADVDLSRLHYYLLPSLPALDTGVGGAMLAAIVDRHGAGLVVIDTMSRVIQGEENDADTFQNFYRHTGLLLKQRGCSLLRLDHGGKDVAKGQRGSSAKGDDVDIVWRLTPGDGAQLNLHRERARMGWIDEHVVLRRQLEPLAHVVERGADQWPAGTKAVADRIIELGLVTAGVRAMMRGLREADGTAPRTSVVNAARRYLSDSSRPGRLIPVPDLP